MIRLYRVQRGFTLLEILVALAVFAGLAASVTQIFASGVDTTLEVEKESYAYILAESKMDETLLLEDAREAAGSGKIEKTDYRYSIEVNEQAYPGEARAFELLHIQVTVAWGAGRYAADVQLESLKTQSKMQGGAL